MSQSPRDADDQEPAVPTPEENDPQQQSDQQATGDMNDAEGLIYDFEVKEQDRWLPIANVARIMKTALPDNAKIAKEAKECMQECVSEFISFITSEASEKCQQEKRKTVNGEDILFAMTSLGFENYGEALKIYLARYREVREQVPRLETKKNPKTIQNLVARGDNQKSGPGTTGAPGGADGQQFDASLGDTLDPAAADGSHDFAYGQGNGNF